MGDLRQQNEFKLLLQAFCGCTGELDLGVAWDVSRVAFPVQQRSTLPL